MFHHLSPLVAGQTKFKVMESDGFNLDDCYFCPLKYVRETTYPSCLYYPICKEALEFIFCTGIKMCNGRLEKCSPIIEFLNFFVRGF